MAWRDTRPSGPGGDSVATASSPHTVASRVRRNPRQANPAPGQRAAGNNNPRETDIFTGKPVRRPIPAARLLVPAAGGGDNRTFVGPVRPVQAPPHSPAIPCDGGNDARDDESPRPGPAARPGR